MDGMGKTFIILFFFIVFFTCRTSSKNIDEGRVITMNFEYNIDNESPYIFDENSKLTKNDFIGQPYLHVIFGKFGVVPIHRKDDNEYVVYCLEDSGLCYIFLEFNQNTGITYFVKEIIIYPNSTQEELNGLYDRICSFDYPEVLMNSGPIQGTVLCGK